MITLIHGSDITASRNYFYLEKSKLQNTITLTGSTITYPDLMQALQGNGLFESDQTILVDELFSKRKPSSELDSITTLISQTTQKVIIWESKDLTAKQLGNFKKADIKQFKLPSVLFSFLDAIYPLNGKNAISLFHQVISDQPEELVFFMLVRHIRTLLTLSPMNPEPSSHEQISEVSRLAPWQKSKLEKQAHLFTKAQLLNFYKQLYGLEYGQKTGTLNQPLLASLDFLLINL